MGKYDINMNISLGDMIGMDMEQLNILLGTSEKEIIIRILYESLKLNKINDELLTALKKKSDLLEEINNRK